MAPRSSESMVLFNADPGYVGIDDVPPLAGHLTKAEVKTLRVGRKVEANGYVTFEYVQPGERRGVVHSSKELRTYYLVGWRWRREGRGERVRVTRSYFGEYDSEGGFVGTRNVFVVLLKVGLEGDGLLECLPEQVRLCRRRP